MKRFLVSQLDHTVDLHEHVESYCDTLLPLRDCELLCGFWAPKARALLEEDLSTADRDACLWVLHMAKGFGRACNVYVHGLSPSHTGNWALLARQAADRLRRRNLRDPEAGVAIRAAKPAKPDALQLATTPHSPCPALPNLRGARVLVVGGEPDPVRLNEYRHDEFSIDWLSADPRRVQSAIARIRSGGVTGTLFLTDCNRHASFYSVRDACSASGVPFVFATLGKAALARALAELNTKLSPTAGGGDCY
jgi:hypothetical protein